MKKLAEKTPEQIQKEKEEGLARWTNNSVGDDEEKEQEEEEGSYLILSQSETTWARYQFPHFSDQIW